MKKLQVLRFIEVLSKVKREPGEIDRSGLAIRALLGIYTDYKVIDKVNLGDELYFIVEA